MTPTSDQAPGLELSNLERLIDFARAAADSPIGFGHLDSTGGVDDSRAPSVLITSRMTFSFAIGSELGLPGCAELAERGIASLARDFHDSTHGGFFSTPPDFGGDGTKSAYDTTFVLLAASTAHAIGTPGAEAVARKALDALLEHFWRDDLGIFANGFDRAFSEPEPYLGANANMHAVEALIAASRALSDASLMERALEISNFMINTHARAFDWMLPEHFHPDGTVDKQFNVDTPADEFRPYGVTIGHLFEWSRLLLEIQHSGVPGTEWIPEAASALYATAKDRGWAADGKEGFVYTLDWEGAPVVDDRLMWVVAEAISAAAQMSHSGLSETADTDVSAWSAHLHERFRDEVHGSWHHQLDADGQPASNIAQGKPDAYHLLHALLIPQVPQDSGLLWRVRGR